MSFHFAEPFDTRALKSHRKAGVNIKDEKGLVNKIKKLAQKSQAVQNHLVHTREVQNNGSTDYFDLSTKHNHENIVQMTEAKIHKAEEKLFKLRLVQDIRRAQRKKDQRY